MRLIIDVKSRHLQEGMAHNCERCPVALAIQDRLADGWRCNVEICGVRFVKAGCEVVCGVALPTVAGNFIRSFDRGHVVGPFSFPLDLRPIPVVQWKRDAAWQLAAAVSIWEQAFASTVDEFCSAERVRIGRYQLTIEAVGNHVNRRYVLRKIGSPAMLDESDSAEEILAMLSSYWAGERYETHRLQRAEVTP